MVCVINSLSKINLISQITYIIYQIISYIIALIDNNHYFILIIIL